MLEARAFVRRHWKTQGLANHIKTAIFDMCRTDGISHSIRQAIEGSRDAASSSRRAVCVPTDVWSAIRFGPGRRHARWQ